MVRIRSGVRGASAAILAILSVVTATGGRLVCAGDPPVAPPATNEVPLDRFFHGTIVGLDGTKVRVKYDFSTPTQEKDWVLGVPWKIAKDAADGISFSDGRLAVRGNVGAHHFAEWEGDLLVTCRLIPDGVKDIGAYLMSPEQLEDYATYTLVETYFHGWDNKTGGETGMMKFGRQFAVGKGGYTGFRYLAMKMLRPEPVAGHPIAFSFGRKGDSLVMTSDDTKLASLEPGNPLKTIQPGFYAIQGSVSVDEIVLEGTLSPRYAALHKLAMRTERPIVPDVAPAPTPGAPPAPVAVDPAVSALVAAYEKGDKSASELTRLVGESTRADVDRAAAATALKSGPHRAVGAAIDLLYSPDLKTRVYGIEIVKALTGKDYGYDPKASEKARSGAIRKLQADLPSLQKAPGW